MDNVTPEFVPPSLVSAQDVIDALRSADPKVRQFAVDRIFPDRSTLLVSCTPQATQCTTSQKIEPATMFSGLLFVQQQIGKMLGLELNWLRTEAEESKKLIVAPPGSFR